MIFLWVTPTTRTTGMKVAVSLITTKYSPKILLFRLREKKNVFFGRLAEIPLMLF